MGRVANRVVRALSAAALGFSTCILAGTAVANDLGETREIRWAGSDAGQLRQKAADLHSAAAIYEYVRNHYEFTSYDGARSDSVNVFGHGMGNDVDLASLLIAMLGRKGSPPLRNGQGVFHRRRLNELDRNTQCLSCVCNSVEAWILRHRRRPADRRDQAHSHVGSGAGASRSLPRMGAAESIDCAATPGSCTWIDLDPSFKLHHFRDPAELVDVSDAVPFDYDALYHADVAGFSSPDGIERANKNPLEIYEEQILKYLRSNPAYDGKTLEDVVSRERSSPKSMGSCPRRHPLASPSRAAFGSSHRWMSTMQRLLPTPRSSRGRRKCGLRSSSPGILSSARWN